MVHFYRYLHMIVIHHLNKQAAPFCQDDLLLEYPQPKSNIYFYCFHMKLINGESFEIK